MEDSTGRSTRKPFLFRMPDDLRAQLLQEAKAAERSLAREIIVRLRASLERTADEAAV
jgi:Arc-like DNA binding domain